MYRLNKNILSKMQKICKKNARVFVKNEEVLSIQKQKKYIILLRFIYLILTKIFFLID